MAVWFLKSYNFQPKKNSMPQLIYEIQRAKILARQKFEEEPRSWTFVCKEQFEAKNTVGIQPINFRCIVTWQINYNIIMYTSAIAHTWMVWRQIVLVLVVLILFIGSRICCSLANDASYIEGQNSYWILWYVGAKVIPTLNHECDNFVRRKWTRKKMCVCRLIERNTMNKKKKKKN